MIPNRNDVIQSKILQPTLKMILIINSHKLTDLKGIKFIIKPENNNLQVIKRWDRLKVDSYTRTRIAPHILIFYGLLVLFAVTFL